MPKTIFTVTTLNGVTHTRTSSTMAYKFAITAGEDRVVSWHTSVETGRNALTQARRVHTAVQLVDVTAQAVELKQTSPAQRNAAARAVLTRQINSWSRHLTCRVFDLAVWEAGGSERTLARLVRDFGETYGTTLHAQRDAQVRNDISFSRQKLAKLIEERAALLAAEAPTALVEA